MIPYESHYNLFGVEEARRNLSKVDPQAQFALTFFDEAQRLITPSGAKTGKSQ